MSTETMATADALFKDTYRGPIIELTNYKTFMLDKIERDGSDFEYAGRRVIFPTEIRGNPSGTSMAEGGTLATPGHAEYLDGIVTLFDHDAGLELTDKSIKISAKSEGAFAALLTRESKTLAKSFRKGVNGQVLGAGTGLMATLTTSPSAATTFTVDKTYGLQVGSIIDVLNISTGAAGAAGLEITGINRTTKVITVGSAVTATATTFGVYKEGSRNLVMPGLQNVTNTSRSLFGIDSSVTGNEAWNGNRRAASGATVGENLIIQLLSDIGANGQGEADTVIMSRGGRDRLAATYQSQKRWNDARAVDIHGGYTAIFVNETPVIYDDDMQKGWTFAFDKSVFAWAQEGDPDWLGANMDNGSIFQLKDASTAGQKKAVWQAWWIWYATLVCVAPNRTGAIPDGADDASV